MTMTLETLGHLKSAQADDVRRLLAIASAADGRAALGEQKRTQIDQQDIGWSAVLAGDGGDLIGYAHIRWDPPGHTPRASAEIVRHPDHRGTEELGFALVGAVRDEIARQGGGTLFIWAPHVEDPSTTLPARAGLRVQRRLLVMVTEVASPPAFDLPDGVRIRAFRPGRDERAFLEVNNAAFATHPEQGGWTERTLTGRMGLEWFDPEGLLMAWRGDEALGFHWTKQHADGRGEVYVIGVHPRAQGLGLGRSLLAAGIAHLHEHGIRQVILYVDGESEAAVGLYESAGFRTDYADVCYAEEVPAGSSL